MEKMALLTTDNKLFVVGEIVQLTNEGRSAGMQGNKANSDKGVVVGFSRGGYIKIRQDGLTTTSAFHKDYWEKCPDQTPLENRTGTGERSRCVECKTVVSFKWLFCPFCGQRQPEV